MDEAQFEALAERELARLEAALEACGADFDIDTAPGGVLELEFEDGSKVIINRHTAAREIWVAARSGGFHFRPGPEGWISARDGAELYALLERVIAEQGATPVRLRAPGMPPTAGS